MREEDIIQQFQDLQSEPKKQKVAVELDPSVNVFVDSLFELQSWELLARIMLPTIEQGKPLRYCSYSLPNEELVKFLNRMFQENYRFLPEILSEFLSQTQEIEQAEQRNEMNSFIRRLEENGGFKPGKEVFELCHSCGFARIVEEDRSIEKCEKCDSSLFRIFEASAPDHVRESIDQHQFLEIYVKKCLQKAGYRLILKKIGDDEIATSIPYKVFGNDVEIDVGAVAGSNLLLFECKTTQLTQTDFNQKLGQIRELLDTVEQRLGGRPDVHVSFVTTKDVHEQVAPESYISPHKLKNVKAYTDMHLPTLSDSLRDYRKKLAV